MLTAHLLLALPLALTPLEPTAWPAQQGADAQDRTKEFQESGGAVLRLSLEEALSIALGNDLGVQIQEVATEVAGFDARGSWGAFDPVLTATASYLDSETETNSPILGVAVITEETTSFGTGVLLPLTTGGSFELTFDVTETSTNNPFVQGSATSTTDIILAQFRQPLLRGGGRGFATAFQREADLEYARQLEGLRRSRQELVSAVETAYWDLVAARGQLEVARTTLTLGQQQLDQNQRRLQAGVGTQVDVLQAEANVAQREEELLLRRTEAHAAGDRLKALLYPGTDRATWNSDVEPVTPLPEATPDMADRVVRWDNALVVALENRPELRQQQLEIEKNEVRLTRSANERRAALDLTLSSRSRGFDTSSSNAFETAVGWDFPQNTAALEFSLPLGNRTASNAERAARAQLRAARLVYDQLESQVVAEVRDAVRQVIYSVRAVGAAEKSRELAQRQLEAEQARYREGLSTNFQVLEFQQQLAAALSSQTNARANLAKALMALDRAQGVLGELER